MSEERKREILAGIFLFAAILVLFFGIAWLKGVLKTAATYRVKVRFNDVGGLRKGDPVDISGVIKGKVSDIKLHKHYVMVYLDINKGVFLPKDSKVWMRAKSFLSGEKYIKIELGKSTQPMPSDSFFIGKYLDEYSLAGLQKVILQLEGTLKKLNVEKLDSLLETTIIDIKKEAIKAVQEFSTGGEKFTTLMEDLDSLVKRTDTLLKKGEKGTVGMLVKDDSLYRETMKLIKETQELIKDIKENPEKYIKPSIKIF